jgi:hypothetical protein
MKKIILLFIVLLISTGIRAQGIPIVPVLWIINEATGEIVPNIASLKLSNNNLNVGTSANQLVQLTATAKLPAVDGSLLTGLSTPTLKMKTANETVNNSNVYQDDDHLTGFSLDASSKYLIKVFLNVAEASTSSKLKAQLVFSSAISDLSNIQYKRESGSSTLTFFDSFGWGAISTYNLCGVSLMALDGPNIHLGAYLSVFTNGACTVKLQWAQYTAYAANTTLAKGSFMEVTKVP